VEQANALVALMGGAVLLGFMTSPLEPFLRLGARDEKTFTACALTQAANHGGEEHEHGEAGLHGFCSVPLLHESSHPV